MDCKKTLEKITSGRWISTVAIVGTYCYVIIMCLILVKEKTMALETFLGLFAAFALLAKEIVAGYFSRSDRAPEVNEKLPNEKPLV